MRNAPMPKGMVTALFLSIVVKKECIVNAFNILSTFIRLTTRVLPLVELHFFVLLFRFPNKKGRHPKGCRPIFAEINSAMSFIA